MNVRAKQDTTARLVGTHLRTAANCVKVDVWPKRDGSGESLQNGDAVGRTATRDDSRRKRVFMRRNTTLQVVNCVLQGERAHAPNAEKRHSGRQVV